MSGMAKKSQSPGGWLFKEEPSSYSYAALEKDGETIWTGVQNPLARKYLRQVREGNRVLYYHTGKERAIVGEMRVAADPTNDPDGADAKAVAVKVEPVMRWNPPVTLEQIKNDPLFAGWELVRLPRLSVMPVSPEHWRRLEEICRSQGASS
jgi:predicted RNA-binding protein with PUA-like domain